MIRSVGTTQTMFMVVVPLTMATTNAVGDLADALVYYCHARIAIVVNGDASRPLTNT